MTTDGDGRFYFPGLPVGLMRSRSKKPGFGKYKRGPIFLLLNQCRGEWSR